MSEKRLPMILVFAGPNGSGKNTITSMIDPIGVYINADEIKKTTGCDDLTAAIDAETRRTQLFLLNSFAVQYRIQHHQMTVLQK